MRSAGEETDRLVQLAEDLLVIARSDQGALPVTPEPIEAGELLASMSERYRSRFRVDGRELTVDAPGHAVLDVDRLRVEQALGNLIENALRHGAGPVRLWAAVDEERARLGVSDEGPGFDPAFALSAFDRFTRADHARSRGGTGLGLAIVEAIARAHGGDARIDAQPGGGAEVSFGVARQLG